MRPHNLSPVVELCSAKVACHELQRGLVAWLACMRSVQEESEGGDWAAALFLSLSCVVVCKKIWQYRLCRKVSIPN